MVPVLFLISMMSQRIATHYHKMESTSLPVSWVAIFGYLNEEAQKWHHRTLEIGSQKVVGFPPGACSLSLPLSVSRWLSSEPVSHIMRTSGHMKRPQVGASGPGKGPSRQPASITQVSELSVSPARAFGLPGRLSRAETTLPWWALLKLQIHE